jgi:LuxR family maltose regulon positive regulatory protein
VSALRGERSWTVEELSARAGVSLRALRRIESSQPVPRKDLRAVETAFGLSPGSLMAQRPHPATLSAKWGAPEISGVYARQRLFGQLGANPCTWIAAPAGYGKTCLARAYVDRAALPCLWYTLEQADSDVATFFSDFGSGLEAAIPDAPLLRYSTDIQDIGAFARAYFKRVFAHLDSAQVLVLDDYHEVAPDAPLHTVIAAVLGVMPRSARLIVLSREAPPAALARAQMYNKVAVVGAEDLCLTLAEALAIARLRRPQEDLSEQSLKALHERAGGWAAGFVLLLRHPTPAAPPPEAVELLFEYFAREVLGTAGEEVRDVLLRTAWLPSMTAEMAEHMTGHPQAEVLLSSLVRGNYFLSRTASAEPLYRYHQLFRAFLLQEARARWSPAEQDKYRRRAAAILEEAGQLDAAVGLWRDLGDWKALTRLIRRAAPPLLTQGRTQSLEGWLGGIPEAAVAERPWLLYWSGRARLHRDPFGARSLFERAYLKFKEAQEVEGMFLGWAAVCETYWLPLDEPGPLQHWLAELDAIRTRWPSFPSPAIEARIACGAFYGLIANDPLHPQLGEWETRLLEALQSEQPTDLRLMIANLLMFHYVWNLGDRGRAALVLGVLRALTGKDATAPLSVVIARTWGDFSYEYCFGGSLSNCQTISEEAQGMAAERGVHLYDFLLWAMPTYGHLTSGRPVETRPYLEKLLGLLDWGRSYDRGSFYFLSSWEAWLDGRLAEAWEAAQKSLEYAKQFGDLHPIGMTWLALSQIELSLGNRAQALRYLADIRHWLRRVRNRLLGFARALALAQFALESGRPARCQRVLHLAFRMGRQEGYVNFQFFRPQTLARLCAQALEAGIEVEYARQLVRKRDLKPPPGAPLTERWPWPVRVSTLGGFGLWVDEEPVQWARKAQRKPIDLLKALVAHGCQRVSSERLADELWPDSEGDAAASALKITLHRLRKLLGHEDTVQVREGKLSLNPSYFWLHLWALEQVLEELDAVATGPAPSRTPVAFERLGQRILGLYRGRFLEGSDLPCAARPRESLHRRYLRAVETLGVNFEAMGLTERAMSCYERGLEVDPAAEGLCQKLISCHLRLGRRSEAIGAYQRCKDALAREQGIAPSPSMQRLYEQLTGM